MSACPHETRTISIVRCVCEHTSWTLDRALSSKSIQLTVPNSQSFGVGFLPWGSCLLLLPITIALTSESVQTNVESPALILLQVPRSSEAVTVVQGPVQSLRSLCKQLQNARSNIDPNTRRMANRSAAERCTADRRTANRRSGNRARCFITSE